MMVKTKIDFTKGYLTKREIYTVKNRLNRINCSEELARETDKEFYENMPSDGYRLTEEQTAQGLKFLQKWSKSHWGEGSGFENYREPSVIENFSHFTLIGFHDNANYYQAQMKMKVYVADYWVHGKNGINFQYFHQGGEVHITG